MKSKRVLIVEARFYNHIADALLQSAERVLTQASISYDVITVPGALEIPAAIKMAMASGQYRGYVALGCVIRGETSHYDIVCNESARGVQQLAIEHSLAIGFGVITADNEDQAIERAKENEHNYGGRAAAACLTMMQHQDRFLKAAQQAA